MLCYCIETTYVLLLRVRAAQSINMVFIATYAIDTFVATHDRYKQYCGAASFHMLIDGFGSDINERNSELAAEAIGLVFYSLIGLVFYSLKY